MKVYLPNMKLMAPCFASSKQNSHNEMAVKVINAIQISNYDRVYNDCRFIAKFISMN